MKRRKPGFKVCCFQMHATCAATQWGGNGNGGIDHRLSGDRDRSGAGAGPSTQRAAAASGGGGRSRHNSFVSGGSFLTAVESPMLKYGGKVLIVEVGVVQLLGFQLTNSLQAPSFNP
jgi:hypothetical protein